MNTNETYKVGIYERLSREDDLDDESKSITHQREAITEFCIANGFRIVKEYVDDGVSGATDDRPKFKELLDDIEKGNINLVITKDTSRLARNYATFTYYVLEYFPSKNVRYIAINDKIDTDKKETLNEGTLCMAFFNELQVRRDSKKIKETFAVAHKEKSSMNDICEVLTKSEENIKINQYEVSDIVHSRLREILELSKKQINLLTKEEISYIIVTGGITEIDGFNLVFKEVFGKNMVVSKVSELGVRNNSFSSALGFIKLYNAKLKFREKLASTVSEEEQELLFNEKKKIDDSSIIGKVYSYFFDN